MHQQLKFNLGLTLEWKQRVIFSSYDILTMWINIFYIYKKYKISLFAALKP